MINLAQVWIKNLLRLFALLCRLSKGHKRHEKEVSNYHSTLNLMSETQISRKHTNK